MTTLVSSPKSHHLLVVLHGLEFQTTRRISVLDFERVCISGTDMVDPTGGTKYGCRTNPDLLKFVILPNRRLLDRPEVSATGNYVSL